MSHRFDGTLKDIVAEHPPDFVEVLLGGSGCMFATVKRLVLILLLVPLFGFALFFGAILYIGWRYETLPQKHFAILVDHMMGRRRVELTSIQVRKTRLTDRASLEFMENVLTSVSGRNIRGG